MIGLPNLFSPNDTISDVRTLRRNENNPFSFSISVLGVSKCNEGKFSPFSWLLNSDLVKGEKKEENLMDVLSHSLSFDLKKK